MKKHRLRNKRLLCAVLSAALMTNSVHFAAVSGASAYKDGTYTGTAGGFNGDITVSVTIKDGSISAIDVTDQKDTPSYWERAKVIIPDIIAANGTSGIDAVSGATYSSEGIINAVNNALAKSNAPECFEDGTGSENSPLVIKTAAQLSAFAKSVDEGENYLGKYIVLDADIDLSEIENWNPIGAEGAAGKNLDKIFAGNFNGRGHVIKGLNIKTNEGAPYSEETNVGLFSTLLSTAKVSGIKLENVDISVSGAKVVRAGGITGDITSKAVSKTDGHAVVDSCSVSGSVSAKTNEAMVMTGGVVGRAAGNATISNCISEAGVESSSGTKIAYGAGIVSMAGNDTYIVNCADTGDVKVLTASGLSLYAGGVAGMMTSAQYNCFSAGNVTVGTIAQADAANCAGIINGALMPAASGKYDYYAESAKLNYVNETGSASAGEAVSHGAGSMNAEGTFTAEKVAEINSAEFVKALNDNLYDIAKTLGDTEFKLWKLSDEGKITLSDEVFINDVIDTSMFESGKGTAEEPYMLKTADQLRAFALSLSEHIDYSGVFIELMSDIDVSDKEWTPIGDSDYVFNGSFDGKGHTVSGMTVGSADTAKQLEDGKNYIGFFSVLGTNAVVKNVYNKEPISADEMFAKLMEYKKALEPYVASTFDIVHDAVVSGKDILLEGQLGSLKDTDFGIYPMVTSSNTIAGYGAVGAGGIPPYEIKDIITVVKAYSSSVGAGEFVSEIFGEEAEELRKRGGDGGEYGATTGRPRRMGWLDLVATRYGCKVQGATQVAFTVLDALGYLDEIPVCVAYELDGERIDYFPSTTKLKRAKPILEVLPGWKTDIRGIKKYEELPENCRNYIEFAEKAVGVPFTMISNGPKREDIIYR